MTALLIFIVQFLLLIVQNTVVSASLQNVSNVGDWCSLPSNLRCGDNAFCLNNTCACKLGSIPSTSNLENCATLKCNSYAQCQQFFNNTKCDYDKKTCSCEDSYTLEQKTQTCVNKPVIGSYCSSSSDCGSRWNNVHCKQNTCRCLMGFTPTKDKLNCKKVQCTTNQECAEFGGSQCSLGSYCQCKLNYKVDEDSQKCVSTKTPVNGRCSLSEECGENALCLQSTCRCLMGYNSTVGDVNCNKAMCRKDNECEKQFGNSECKRGECVCEADNSVDWTTQKCTRSKVEINDYCFSSSSCGDNAYCDSFLRCRCKFGYEVTSSKIDCRKLNCYNDYQCSNLFPNSRCSSSSCSCKPFYLLENNTCRKTVTDSPFGLSAAVLIILYLLPVFAVAFCIGVCCYCCCGGCCRQRRQQLQAPPLPRQMIVIDNPMRQRNIHFSATSAQSVTNSTTTGLYPELPTDPPPPYNPDYYEPPQRKL